MCYVLATCQDEIQKSDDSPTLPGLDQLGVEHGECRPGKFHPPISRGYFRSLEMPVSCGSLPLCVIHCNTVWAMSDLKVAAFDDYSYQRKFFVISLIRK